MKLAAIFSVAVVCSAIATVSMASPAFNKSQLEQFEQTNHCAGCDLSSAIIGGNHSGADLTNANLSNITSDHESLNFSLANLTSANFTGAFLQYANFSQADLTGARFDGAHIRGANFFGAKGVSIENAMDACDVIMPDGKLSVSCY